MATNQPTTNHAAREFSPRARALTRQRNRAELLLEQHPGDAMLVEIRAILAAAVARCQRREVGSGEADAMAALARQALNATEALARAKGR